MLVECLLYNRSRRLSSLGFISPKFAQDSIKAQPTRDAAA
ncbi:hypothetical protein BURMUCGD2M_1223 [Burkholderia multivorans CGD2M]|nr:hypothetical protein BURMUCGD2M_1223 [Burkholderia multivorans CGD2M]